MPTKYLKEQDLETIKSTAATQKSFIFEQPHGILNFRK
jgi:hypothetical protein